MTPLPHYNYKQKNDWTCGPAVARMILHCFGKTKTIKELCGELRTDKNGTSNENLIRVLKKHGFKFRIRKDARVSDVRRYLKGHLVITAYRIPKQGVDHYSIIKKISRRKIFFHDPWFGAGHSYNLEYFSKYWRDDEARRWVLAVEKRRLAGSSFSVR